MTTGVRLIPKDAPRPIPPRTFAWIMFGLAAVPAVLAVRILPLTWGTEHFPQSVFVFSIGILVPIALGVRALRIAPTYLEPIRDDF